MGHTVWSQRIVLNSLVDELQSYGKALRGNDKHIYEQLLKKCFKHFGSTSYASSMHAWAFLLLSIMLEQEKKLQELEDGIRILVDKIPGGNNNGEGRPGVATQTFKKSLT